MKKSWPIGGVIILFLGVIFFYRLPAVASTSTCPEGYKCIFNDNGPLLIQSQGGNIDLRATSSDKYIYLNYINAGSYGLGVSAGGLLYHNGNSIVVADGGYYSININGLSKGLGGYFDEWSPDILLQGPDQQLFLYSLSPSYWGVDNPADSVTGVSSIYSFSRVTPPLVSQLALVRDKLKDGPPRQYLQYRFNDINNPNDWGEWTEVCDSSNNCHNFLNLLDDSSNNSLVMYQDPDMLVNSGLTVDDPNSLADCSSLYTSGGVISCGSGGGEISGSGTTNYLPRWSDASTLADSILYQNSTNIGLGTTSPFTKFHIYDASSGPIITLSGLNNNYRGLTIKDTSNNEKWFVGSNDNNNFVIRQGGSTNLLTASSSGNIGIGDSSPSNKLSVNGTVAATTLQSNAINCSNGVITNASGEISCATTPFLTTDQYWTGTSTNLNSTTARTSLGLGSLATLNAVSGGQITDGTIMDADINSSASISATKIQYGSFFITSTGTSGQVWTSDGSGAGNWTNVSGNDKYYADGNGLELVDHTFGLELDGTTLSTSSSGLKVNTIGTEQITNGTITNNDISSSAGIGWTKINKVGSNLSDLATRKHSSLTNLDSDDHPQYVLLAGRESSQTIIGSTAVGGMLQLQATSNTTSPDGESPGIKFLVGRGGGSDIVAMTILHNGKVGIGTTSPNQKLSVEGNINVSGNIAGGSLSSDGSKISSNQNGVLIFVKFTDYDNSSYFVDPSTTTDSIYTQGSIKSDSSFKLLSDNGQYLGWSTVDTATLPTFSWIGDSDTGLFRKAANTVAFTTNGTEKFSLDASGKAVFTNGSASLMTIEYSSGAKVTIGNGGDTSKLDVGTVDPIYTIGGQKYATYMANMTGVKEETSGVLVLDQQSAGLFMARLDFQNAPEGSDIWLFGRTTNLINNQEHFNQTACLLTPNFTGPVWYEKDWDGRSIYIFARPDNINRASVEVSYRLTAPRFDQKDWSNYSNSQHEGFNLDKLLK